MIFQSNDKFCPSMDTGILCDTVADTQEAIDSYWQKRLAEKKDEHPEREVAISLSLRWWNNIDKWKRLETLN